MQSDDVSSWPQPLEARLAYWDRPQSATASPQSEEMRRTTPSAAMALPFIW
jgi:hypothetical protein